MNMYLDKYKKLADDFDKLENDKSNVASWLRGLDNVINYLTSPAKAYLAQDELDPAYALNKLDYADEEYDDEQLD